MINNRYDVGSKVAVSRDNDNDNYIELRYQQLEVTKVYKSVNEYHLYDEGVGEALYRVKTDMGKEVGFLFYEYELEDA